MSQFIPQIIPGDESSQAILADMQRVAPNGSGPIRKLVDMTAVNLAREQKGHEPMPIELSPADASALTGLVFGLWIALKALHDQAQSQSLG